MRYLDYINVENKNVTSEIISHVKKDCSQYMRMLKNVDIKIMLVRTHHKTITDYLKIIPRTDRNPYSTPLAAHKFLDDWFQKKFGWKARSEGVFCWGRKWYEHISGSTQTGLLFPFDNFKFIWSPDIYDLYASLPFSYRDTTWFKSPEKYLHKLVDEKLKYSGYTDKNFKNGIEKGNEIMIKCSAYYIVHHKYGLSIRRAFGLKNAA